MTRLKNRMTLGDVSVFEDNSTANVAIENQTAGDDSPWRYLLSSVSGTKPLVWFCIADCGIAIGSQAITRRLQDAAPLFLGIWQLMTATPTTIADFDRLHVADEMNGGCGRYHLHFPSQRSSSAVKSSQIHSKQTSIHYIRSGPPH